MLRTRSSFHQGTKPTAVPSWRSDFNSSAAWYRWLTSAWAVTKPAASLISGSDIMLPEHPKLPVINRIQQFCFVFQMAFCVVRWQQQSTPKAKPREFPLSLREDIYQKNTCAKPLSDAKFTTTVTQSSLSLTHSRLKTAGAVFRCQEVNRSRKTAVRRHRTPLFNRTRRSAATQRDPGSRLIDWRWRFTATPGFRQVTHVTVTISQCFILRGERCWATRHAWHKTPSNLEHYSQGYWALQ